MMFSLLLRLQIVKHFVPGCTGRLRQMGLIVITISLFSFVLQQPILIGWDYHVVFNMLLRDQNYFLIVVWSSGVIICLM